MIYQTFHQYPSFLVFVAVVITVLIICSLTPAFIRIMKSVHLGQQIRDDGPASHLVKQGTPTMGGLIMILAVVISILLVGIPDSKTWALLFVSLAGALIGFYDDFRKIRDKSTDGLSAKGKLICQFAVACTFTLVAVNSLNIAPTIVIPFLGTIDLGVLTTVITLGGGQLVIPWLYLVYCLLLLVGMCNAVNLTDGLDGLASGCVMMVMMVLAGIAYRQNALEPSIFAATMCGACVGFLWFNSHPADIFMGDTGSLSLGMTVGALAILTKTEFLILLIGGLFVVEALSVMIQVYYFRKTGKRIFLMAPLHHHFEKKGWGETKVVVRFWMISGLLAASGFALFFASSMIS